MNDASHRLLYSILNLFTNSKLLSPSLFVKLSKPSNKLRAIASYLFLKETKKINLN